MKRKIFTSLAAAGLLACAIVTTSAAEQNLSPRQFCFHWNKPCFEIQVPSMPDDSVQNSTQAAPMSQLEKQAAALVNQARTENGLAPLTIDANLSVKARIKASDMKVNQYFDHTSPTYGSPFTMMNNLGIDYRSAGENIARGYRSAQAVVSAWMNSPSHRANILSSRYTTMGIGYVDGYWTQWFIG